jgi:hypothetical protein
LNKVPREFDLNQGTDGGRSGLRPNALLQFSATKAPQTQEDTRSVVVRQMTASVATRSNKHKDSMPANAEQVFTNKPV